MQNRRRYKRFAATAFLNIPVFLKPLPPFFGHTLKGKLIDLSAGGMAIAIKEIIPQGSRLNLTLTFPDQTTIDSTVNVIRVVSKEKKFLHGIEFLNLGAEIVQRIERMSSDYIDCEARIRSQATEICQQQCAFFNMCTKQHRLEPVTDPAIALHLAFRSLQDSALHI